MSIAACLVAIFLIDRIGRKPLLLIGSVGMAVTLGVLTVAFATGDLTSGGLHLAPRIGLLALISANLYVVFFNLSWGPVMWVMLGEMFPNQMRGSGLAVSGAAQWTANFAISGSFPVLAKSLGLPLTYGFYTACAFLSIFFRVADGPRNPRHGIGGHGRLKSPRVAKQNQWVTTFAAAHSKNSSVLKYQAMFSNYGSVTTKIFAKIKIPYRMVAQP